MDTLDLLNTNELDESILVGRNIFSNDYSSVDGEDGDEDNTDYEDEESEVGGVEPADLPKFRQLVNEKKLSLKSQYGKSRWVVTETWRNSPSVGSTVSLATALAHPRKTVWRKGWRRQWRDFKRSGGLAQLKQQAKGLAPIPSNTPTQTTMTGIPKKRLIPTGAVATKAPVASKGKTETSDSGSSEKMAAPTDDDKILGMPKTAFYVGLGVLVLIGGFFVYKKFIVKK